jgi:adenosylhomocysteine nucleosidase
MKSSPPVWGVMAALPQELGDLLHRLDNPSTEVWAGRSFHRGHVAGQPIVAVTSRIGKVAAALTATLLIDRFQVDHLVFVGVAGGLGHGVHRGDVVVANRLVQHDLSAWPLFPVGEIPLLGLTELPTDPTLTQQLEQAARHALVAKQQLHVGLIASGDQFIQGQGPSQAIRARYPETLAVEMEGAAVAQVCTECGVPFGVIRTISDTADDSAAHNFNAFIEDTAAPLASRVLAELFPTSQSAG